MAFGLLLTTTKEPSLYNDSFLSFRMSLKNKTERRSLEPGSLESLWSFTINSQSPESERLPVPDTSFISVALPILEIKTCYAGIQEVTWRSFGDVEEFLLTFACSSLRGLITTLTVEKALVLEGFCPIKILNRLIANNHNIFDTKYSNVKFYTFPSLFHLKELTFLSKIREGTHIRYLLISSVC